MMEFFKESGYPDSVINSALNRLSVDLTSIPIMKKTTGRVPLVPLNTEVTKILMKNFNILQECKDTKNVFRDPPIVAYRRDKNLSDILVHSAEPQERKPPGTTTCDRHVCRTCQHVSYAPSINGNTGSFNIHQSFDCTSRNIIYAVTCSKCDKLYIGETKRRLGDRFVEHLRYATNNNRDTPITRHYNDSPHVPSDIRVTGLLHTSGSDFQRWVQEQRIIFNCGTLAGPDSKGLNVQFTAFKH